MGSKPRELPEHAERCLNCACENESNPFGRALLEEAGALTATGVVAAIFIAGSEAHERLTIRARAAIAGQRAMCERQGPFRPDRCTVLR